MNTDTPSTAREYLRVSDDPDGTMKSPDEQHEENERAAKTNRWTLGEPYAEAEAISASRFSSKRRPDFDRLCADLEAGTFGADLLILWESSRGSRKLSEWAAFLELLEGSGVLVHVTSHGHTYDLSRPRDRRSLQEDGVDSEYESGKTSERVRRAMTGNATAGKPHGRVPYGYRRRYDPVTRKLIAQEPDPGEAAVVREMYERLRQGHSLKAIAADLNDRGVRTRPPQPCGESCKRKHEHVQPGTPGREWSPQHVRNVVLRPLYGALRVHQPGKHHGTYLGPLDEATAATWPPLVDSRTFYAVRELLLSPARTTTRAGRGVHLLSMIAVCGVCGSPLSATERRRYREYQCHRSACVHISADDLDEYTTKVMLAYLASPETIAGLRSEPEDSTELARVRADLSAARAEVAALRKAVKQGKLSTATLVELEPALVARAEGLASGSARSSPRPSCW